MDKLEIKQGSFIQQTQYLYRPVGPVETNIFLERIDFYHICPSDRHVCESLNMELNLIKLPTGTLISGFNINILKKKC
jgi:hypothetical protein